MKAIQAGLYEFSLNEKSYRLTSREYREEFYPLVIKYREANWVIEDELGTVKVRAGSKREAMQKLVLLQNL